MSLRKPFSEEDVGPLLTLGDRVVWLFEHGPEHGWVRWIGRIPVVSPNWTIGVEFDNPIGAGDGKFGGKRYFYARNDHAYFLPNSSLLRACDYNSSFRKQNSLERSIPGIQAKMFTFPHQYSVAKYPFPGSAKDVEATHLTSAHLISSCSSRERGVCGTSKLHQSHSTYAKDEPNLSDYDNWLDSKDPCNVHVKSWKSSSTHSVVSCPPVLLPKMLVTREQSSSSDSDVNFGSLRSLMSCFTLGSHRKKKRRKKKKKSHRLVIVTGSDNSNYCCSSGSASAAQVQQHACEGDIRHSAKKYGTKELPCVSSGPKAIWRYSLQEKDLQKIDACEDPVTIEVTEQKAPPKLPPKTCTRKKRLAPQPPGDSITPTGTLQRKQPLPPVAVSCSSSSMSTESLSLTRRRPRKKPAPQPPRRDVWHSIAKSGTLPSVIEKGLYANELAIDTKPVNSLKVQSLPKTDVNISGTSAVHHYLLETQHCEQAVKRQEYGKNLADLVVKPDLPVKTILSPVTYVDDDSTKATECVISTKNKSINDSQDVKMFHEKGKRAFIRPVISECERSVIQQPQASSREVRSSTLPPTRQCPPILEEEEPYASTAVGGESNNLESVLKRNSNVLELLDAFSKLELNSDETQKDSEPESPKHSRKQGKSLKSLFQKHPADASKVVSTKWTYTPMESKKDNFLTALKPGSHVTAVLEDKGAADSKTENIDTSLWEYEAKWVKDLPSQSPMNMQLASCRMNLKPISHSPDFGNVFCKIRQQGGSSSAGNPPWKHQQQTARMLPDELRPRFSELPAVEAKNKTSRGKKEGGGGLVAETVSCANAASTAACSLEMMAGKASPVSLPQISTHANAHTSSGRMRPPVHPNSPTALMQAKLPALFRQLEEAISKGEHDRAAILARELAMYKVSCSLRRVRKVAPDPKQFIVKMYVEDRKSHVGPFSLPVHPEMTVSNLKKKVEAEYNIPARVQRWILGKNLATDDGATLEHFGVSHSACPVFLYLVSPAEELRAEEVIRNRCWKPPDSVASTEEGEDLANAIARQEPSDASSTLDVLLNDYAAGWTCQLCGINNTEPGTCAMCGVAMIMDASRQSVGADQNVKTTLAYNAEPGEVHDQLEPSNSPAQAHLPLNEEDASPVEEPEQAPSPQTSLPQDYMRLVELDEQDLVPSMEAFECSVCFLGIEPGQGVLLRDCLHMFCRECLSSSVRYAEEAMVKCPFRNNEYSCSSHLQEREIRALVSPEVYEHHLSRSVKTAESQAPNSFHCKTPDCPGWCMLEDNVNTFMCPVCGHQNCLTCRAIHEGKNCLQYQDELDFNAPNGQEAKQTKEYLDKMVQEGQAMHCPQCRVIVMKKWGCDWLKCSVCQTEICWVTKGPRWGPQGKGDTSAGCKCGVNGVKCHPKCNYCH